MSALPESFTSWPMNIKSGIAEAGEHRYHCVTRGSEHWLYADSENQGDNCYHGFSDPKRGGDGFCGRAMKFTLVDGSELTLYGPYKCAERYLHEVGVNLSDKHKTRGVVALDAGPYFDGGAYFHQRTYSRLLHLDTEWVLGEFERVEKIAQRLADERGEPVYCYYETQGGSTARRKFPAESSSDSEAKR